MTKAVAKPTPPREPTEAEAQAIADAKAAAAERPVRTRPPKGKATFLSENCVQYGAPHTDQDGFYRQMMEALGTDSGAVYQLVLDGTDCLGPQRGRVESQEDADKLNRDQENALAVIAAIGPQNSMESLLALQMLAAHNASMKMSRLVQRAEGQGVIESARLMNQTMRTFAAQIEAMNKLRNGGKQQMEVRYVYVDARTQQVVQQGGHAPAGYVGEEQPHAPNPALGHAPAPGLPMWSADPSGHAVPSPGYPRPAEVPDAWGAQPRRAEGRGERELSVGDVDTGNDRGEGDGASVRQDRAEAA